MDPFRLCVAIGPLAVYLIVIGAINLSRRSRVVGGGRDLAALGMAVSGLVLVGPFELLLPTEPWFPFGRFAWLLAIVVYVLMVTLVVLSSRPRLTIYNVAPPIFQAALAHSVDSLDDDPRWTGNHLVLPGVEVELHVEPNPQLRCVALVAAHDQQNLIGWRQLEQSLASELKRIERPRNPWGGVFVAVGLALLATIAWQLTKNTDAITQGFFDLLQID